MIKVLSGYVDIRDGILTMDSCQVEVWREEAPEDDFDWRTVYQELKNHFLNSEVDFDKEGHSVSNCNFILKHFPPSLENK